MNKKMHRLFYELMMSFHLHHLLMIVEEKINDSHVDIGNEDVMIDHRILKYRLYFILLP